MRSLTVARRAGGAVDGSSTTAPIAAGPGFPREPPSAKIQDARRARAGLLHGTRMQPQLSQCATVRRRRLLDAFGLGAGIVRWQPWHVVPTSRAAPTPLARARQLLVLGEERSFEAGRDLVARAAARSRPRRRCLRRRPRASCRIESTSVASARRAPRVRRARRRAARVCSIRARARGSRLALVTPELVDVGLQRLELPGRRHLTRVQARLFLPRPSPGASAPRRRGAARRARARRGGCRARRSAPRAPPPGVRQPSSAVPGGRAIRLRRCDGARRAQRHAPASRRVSGSSGAHGRGRGRRRRTSAGRRSVTSGSGRSHRRRGHGRGRRPR